MKHYVIPPPKREENSRFFRRLFLIYKNLTDTSIQFKEANMKHSNLSFVGFCLVLLVITEQSFCYLISGTVSGGIPNQGYTFVSAYSEIPDTLQMSPYTVILPFGNGNYYIPEVPAGDYVVLAFQDLNGNTFPDNEDYIGYYGGLPPNVINLTGNYSGANITLSSQPTGYIAGDISYSGTTTGPTIVEAYDNPNWLGSPVSIGILYYEQTFPMILSMVGNGHFEIYLPGDTYYLRAFMDLNFSFTPDPGEPFGEYRDAFGLVPVTLSEGQTIVGIDFGLDPPYINISPGAFDVTLLEGDTTSSTLTIENIGLSPLEYEISDFSAQYGDILIFIDDWYWFHYEIFDILDSLSISYNTANSDEMSYIDMSPYSVVLIPSDQDYYFYDNFANNLDRFENYIEEGGTLEFHGFDYWYGWGYWNMLPGGVIQSGSGSSSNNYIQDPTHPIVAGLSYSVYGEPASDDYLSNLPMGTNVILSRYASGSYPTAVEYTLGLGTVIATTMAWELNSSYGYSSGQCLSNALTYSTSGAGSWLSYSPTSGVVLPGASAPVSVTFNAMWLESGVYERCMVVSSNDLITPYYYIPVQLTVISDSSLSVALTPDNPPILIPETGGNFGYNIALYNTYPDQQTTDIWTYITLPGVGVVGPIIQVMGVNIPGLTIIDRNRTQDVPQVAPAGIYTYYACIGEYPWEVISADSFTFEKLGEGEWGKWTLDDWRCYGESFKENYNTFGEIIPDNYYLSPPYPNPFNPETNIEFGLPESGDISLVIYNLQGREVAILFDGWHPAGIYHTTFNGSKVSSGVYFACLKADNFSLTQKLLLVK